MHQPDYLAHSRNVRVEAIDEDEVQVLAEPAEKGAFFPLLRHGDKDVPPVEGVEEQKRVNHTQVICGNDKGPGLGDVLVPEDFHPGDKVEQSSDEPPQEITHEVILHE